MKVWMNGGTGGVGAHILKQLVEKGAQVTILSRDPDRVPSLKSLPGVTLAKGDVQDPDSYKDTLPGHDAVIHIALCWGERAVEMLQNDVLPAVRVFELAADAGVEQGIFTSSTAAFGDFRRIMREDMIRMPIDYYCAGKMATEGFALGITHKRDIRINIIRPGLMTGRSAYEGSRESLFGPVKDCVQKALAGKPIEVERNSGTQVISYPDIASLYVRLLESDRRGEIYHALGQRFIDAEQVAREATARLGSKSEIIVKRNPMEDSPKLFDLTKIQRDFGFAFDAWDEICAQIDLVSKRLRQAAQ